MVTGPNPDRAGRVAGSVVFQPTVPAGRPQPSRRMPAKSEVKDKIRWHVGA
jgi:hypothetical protein